MNASRFSFGESVLVTGPSRLFAREGRVQAVYPVFDERGDEQMGVVSVRMPGEAWPVVFRPDDLVLLTLDR